MITNRTKHRSAILQSLTSDIYACATILTILNTVSWSNNREHHLQSVLLLQTSSPASSSTVQLSLNQGFEFFSDLVVLPPEVRALILDTSITQSSMALMLHLSVMTSKLPLRMLQVSLTLCNPNHANQFFLFLTSKPLIRTATFDATMLGSLQTWATEDSGRLARATL